MTNLENYLNYQPRSINHKKVLVPLLAWGLITKLYELIDPLYCNTCAENSISIFYHDILLEHHVFEKSVIAPRDIYRVS